MRVVRVRKFTLQLGMNVNGIGRIRGNSYGEENFVPRLPRIPAVWVFFASLISTAAQFV